MLKKEQEAPSSAPVGNPDLVGKPGPKLFDGNVLHRSPDKSPVASPAASPAANPEEPTHIPFSKYT